MGATLAHKWEAAETLFRTALRQAETFPHCLEQAEIRRFHAMMLMNRGGPGDRESAQTTRSGAGDLRTDQHERT